MIPSPKFPSDGAVPGDGKQGDTLWFDRGRAVGDRGLSLPHPPSCGPFDGRGACRGKGRGEEDGGGFGVLTGTLFGQCATFESVIAIL